MKIDKDNKQVAQLAALLFGLFSSYLLGMETMIKYEVEYVADISVRIIIILASLMITLTFLFLAYLPEEKN